MTEAQKSMLQKWDHNTVCIESMLNFNLKLYTLLSFDKPKEALNLLCSPFFEKIKCIVGLVRCQVFM